MYETHRNGDVEVWTSEGIQEVKEHLFHRGDQAS